MRHSASKSSIKTHAILWAPCVTRPSAAMETFQSASFRSPYDRGELALLSWRFGRDSGELVAGSGELAVGSGEMVSGEMAEWRNDLYPVTHTINSYRILSFHVKITLRGRYNYKSMDITRPVTFVKGYINYCMYQI